MSLGLRANNGADRKMDQLLDQGLAKLKSGRSIPGDRKRREWKLDRLLMCQVC